jgi:hypothetical protein
MKNVPKLAASVNGQITASDLTLKQFKLDGVVLDHPWDGWWCSHDAKLG